MSSLTANRIQTESEPSRYLFKVSNGGIDTQWDAFLSELPSNHHLQSSLWSEIKSFNDWATRRVTAFRNGKLVGGAQILIRNVRFAGAVGYVPKGPIFSPNDGDLEDELLKKMFAIAAEERLKLLFVQPAATWGLEDKLQANGFRTFPIETAPTATILISLQEEIDLILSRMKKGMRNQVHRSQKRGIQVRLGNRNDLSVFHQLLATTGKRRGFSVFELAYFQRMWDVLAPSGKIKLFMSEHNGEPVSAQICIPFGDTLVAKQIGWSGQHRSLHPNEALDWFTIQWAKNHGYKYYDLEGIERPAAQAITNGMPLPDEFRNSPSAYKLRLGGEVKIYPQAYGYFANPVLRTMYNRFGYQVARWSMFQNAISRFRTR